MTALFDFLDTFPLAVMFALVIMVVLAFAFLVDRIMHRVLRKEVRELAGPSAAVIVTVLASIYAILIAFVIVNEWQAFNDANEHVSVEAASMVATYHNSEDFPPDAARAVQQAILDYDHSVLVDDFGSVTAHGASSEKTGRALDRLFQTVQRVAPEAKQSVFYNQTIVQLDDIVKARRERLASDAVSIPGALFSLIVIIGGVMIVVASALNTKHRRSHLMLLFSLALVIGLNLALVIALDRPFAGAISVSKQPLIEGVLARAAH